VVTVPAFVVPFMGDALIQNIQFSGTVITFDSGPWWTYYATVINLYMVLGLGVLAWGRYRANWLKSTLIKRQISYVFLSSALSLAIALIVNLPQALYPIPLAVSRIGLYGMGFMVVFTAYAIVRARFFEIRIAIGRAIAFLVLTVVSSGLLAIFLLNIASRVFEVPIDPRLFASLVCIVVAVAISFEHIRIAIERITDKLFFKRKYDAALLQKKLGSILIETIELDDLSNQALETICEEFHLDKSALVLETNRGMLWHAKGFPSVFPRELQPLLIGEESTQIVSFDELADGPKKELFRTFDIALTVPLRIKGRDVAMLLLGPKLSGEPFNVEDISFFEISASEIAIGIQNAKSYDDLKQLSKELELRVADRTKDLEESKRMEVAKAKEVARLKDEFVFLAVHELRTPIVAIKGFLELTEGSQKYFPVDIRRNLSAISEASTHMSHLINDLLEISRSDSGSLKIEVAPQEFKPILDEVLAELTPLIEQKKLHVDISIRKLPKVLCDTRRLKEVIENLVANAIKYNRDGGSIFISAFRQAGEPHMVFEIRDTGFGIPKNQQDKIFQKFFRAITPETQEVLGTGLGLFITRMLVERMGGTLMFSSLEHEGSTFAFSLPIANGRAKKI
jgi:signal transduction histidine kinase